MWFTFNSAYSEHWMSKTEWLHTKWHKKLIYFWIVHLTGKNCVEGCWMPSRCILIRTYVKLNMQLPAEVYFIVKCLTFVYWKHVIWMWLGNVCFICTYNCPHELNNYGLENNLKICFLALYCLIRRVVGVHTSCSLHAFNLCQNQTEWGN